MRLLYLDASGDPGWCPPDGNSRCRWYVLAGLVIGEAECRNADKRVSEVVEKYFDWTPPRPRELRCSSLLAGAKPFSELTEQERIELENDIFDLVLELGPTLFAAAIDKPAHKRKYGSNAISPKIWALQLIAPRFEKFLNRVNEHGMIIMDAEEMRRDKDLRKLIRDGKRFGIILQSNISPDPFRTDTTLPRVVESVMFMDSDESGIIQLADFCSHSIWKHFEKNTSHRFNQIYPLFDSVDEAVYGLKVWPT